MNNKIKVRGAREHNLKNIDVEIPKGKFVTFTGVSGSGKSSLALDTIFAEGQRRYIQSLSSYARQFLGSQAKPDVDQIEGLSPAIAISQKKPFHNPRSTVGTITEVYDFFRLLFARIGHPHCPQCGREVKRQSLDEITASVLQVLEEEADSSKGARILVLAPVVKDKKGEYSALFENMKKQGFLRARIDGEVRQIDEDFVLIKTNRHTIEIITDRLVISKKDLESTTETIARLKEAIAQALELAEGEVIVSQVQDGSFDFPEKPKKLEDYLFSERFACPVCNLSLEEPEPRTFSFNSPHGACPKCDGLGTILRADPEQAINPRLTVNEGGILALSSLTTNDTWYRRKIEAVAEEKDIDLDKNIGDLSKEKQDILLHGCGDEEFLVKGRNRQGKKTSFEESFAGILVKIESRYQTTDSNRIRKQLERYMYEETCPACQGTRLKPSSISVTVRGKNIAEIAEQSIEDLKEWTEDLAQSDIDISDREHSIAEPILREINARLKFLNSVGLSYLNLNRSAATLSGGEAQRIRLASQIGSGLSGVLYVLDEPSVGLHQRDMAKLINTLKDLRDLDNTVVVVEHDAQTIRGSDWVIDFGPGGGKLGGEVIAGGTPKDISVNKESLTGDYLAGRKKVKIVDIEDSFELSNPEEKIKEGELTLVGGREHNLKNIDVNFPFNKFICVTGVSGSGKSTLVMDTLYPSLRGELNRRVYSAPGDHDGLLGAEKIDKVYEIDQSPIGQSPRSNPATYTGAFDYIREAFARTREARLRGFDVGQFSFNTKGGRCEACEGQGVEKIEMQFLPDVYVTCEVCEGQRYNESTLEIKYRGKNIKEILDMTVSEALNFFSRIKLLTRRLETLSNVGLGYLELGQPAPTLSGGEAQRVRLAKELSKRPKGHTFYILDEPTIGLHPDDLTKLLSVLHHLVDRGNTVLVIEHNLDVIKSADWIIDLGPEGGEDGGEVIFSGTPKEIIECEKSYTGQALKNY
ncbi:MAG: excinuclease ABC subunit UvrA [Patescibacteria group bacterium]